ncbi:Serine hydroxymethyltransferase, partial [Fasciola gigantica]
YYGGNEIIDKVEVLAQHRLLELFGLKQRGQRLDQADWGATTELIDYDALERDALNFYPKLIVAGITAYPRLLDYARFRKICDSVGAVLLSDMSHISGLVAAGVVPSPFTHSDVVSSTTHKTLRGPRSGMIFYRRTPRPGGQDLQPPPHVPVDQLEPLLNNAVFPSLQGGPHENVIAGVACMAREANTPEFVQYAKQILSNAQAFARSLESRGIRLVSGGTDVHFVLVDLAKSPGKPKLGRGDGSRVQLAADLAGITLNKNTVLGDKSAQQPSGLRLGTPALTTRGFQESDFEQVAAFLDELLDITILAKSVSKNLKAYRAALTSDEEIVRRLKDLRARVGEFASKFPMPGWDEI